MNIFTPLQIRLFLGTFVIAFSVVLLGKLGISLEKIISPIPKQVAVIDQVRPKLARLPNDFQVKKQQSLIPQASADTVEEYDNAKAYLVMDFDSGNVIAEKNLSEKESIASLTKIMTAIVAIDLLPLEAKLSVTENAASIEPTKIGVVAGQSMTLTELLHASLLTSANDATEVIREGVDTYFKEPIFIQAMNEKARLIGLKNSHFENPQGFDGVEHFSTVEDLAILSHYALTNYPIFSEIVAKDYTFLEEDQHHKQYDLYNWNGLLGVYPNVSGVKIGNTENAGRTTVVVAERSGKKILVALLGTPGVLERDLWAAELLDLGFAKTLNLTPINVTEEQLREKYATWEYFQ